MNRLTKEKFYASPEDIIKFSSVDEANFYNKLHDYEDIDEKLGIEYPVLVKALTEGFYAKYLNGVEINKPSYFYGYEIKADFINRTIVCGSFIFYFKDFGKTWALNKEVLEND